MNSGPTITLLRILFVAFTAFLGSEIGASFWDGPRTGACGGIAFGLFVVLEELHTLADSQDVAKREKGRLALSRLQEMQRNPAINLTIHERTIDAFAAVDSKLVQLAKIMNARLLSNDGNLCSIARLQNII